MECGDVILYIMTLLDKGKERLAFSATCKEFRNFHEKGIKNGLLKVNVSFFSFFFMEPFLCCPPSRRFHLSCSSHAIENLSPRFPSSLLCDNAYLLRFSTLCSGEAAS